VTNPGKEVFLAGAVIIYVVLFSALSIARYETFHATTLDLGIFTQVTWNTAHGRLFETSIGRATNTELIGSYLGNHVRPILLVLAPFYRLWSDPRFLHDQLSRQLHQCSQWIILAIKTIFQQFADLLAYSLTRWYSSHGVWSFLHYRAGDLSGHSTASVPHAASYCTIILPSPERRRGGPRKVDRAQDPRTPFEVGVWTVEPGDCPELFHLPQHRW
jgi:hypothetical protein